MKTISNKTRRPLRIHLSQGRVLHLGPGKKGQIAARDAERESVKTLVAAGDVDVFDEGAHPESGTQSGGPAHPDSRGHHPSIAVKKRGDR